MKDILKSISIEMIRLKDFEFKNEQIESGWFGNNPVTDSEIESVETRLGVQLPEDYKAFLKVSNGFHAFSTTEPTFHSIRDIDFLKNIDEELIEIWKQEETLEDGLKLERSIIIAGIEEEQYFLLIPPEKQNQPWQYWKFACWIPGEEEYVGLKEYFNNVLEFMKVLDE